MFVYYNANPINNLVIDCTVRAISAVTGKSWDETYIGLVVKGYEMKDMPNSNRVWHEYLKDLNYSRSIIPDTCPNCYTVADFCVDHPRGIYLLATGDHVIAVIDGSYYDTWDSGNCVPIYYWTEREEKNHA